MNIAKIVTLASLALCFAIVTPLYGQQNWCDDFESYPPDSSICGPDWFCLGNSSFIADDSISYNGNQSGRMHGVVGGCWATDAFRSLGTYFPMTIEFAVRNGTEDISGCHPYRASAGVKAGSLYTDPGAFGLLHFLENGDLVISLPSSYDTLTGFSLEQWYFFKIDVWIADGYLHGKYWVDGQFLGEYSHDIIDLPNLVNASHLHLSAQEGTVWFDDVCVSALTDIPTLSEWGMLIMGLLLLAVGTVAVVRRRKAVVDKSLID